MMSNTTFPSARKSGLVVQEVPDEVLIYDLESNKAHCLNKTAAAVWHACNGSNSVDDITAVLEQATGSKVTDEMVWLALDQLSENNLLEAEVKANFNGQTRREVLKKIGLASVIALPIVASLVAPKSALASASCGCTASSQCAGRGCVSAICCNADLICAPELPAPNQGCIPG